MHRQIAKTGETPPTVVLSASRSFALERARARFEMRSSMSTNVYTILAFATASNNPQTGCRSGSFPSLSVPMAHRYPFMFYHPEQALHREGRINAVGVFTLSRITTLSLYDKLRYVNLNDRSS
jgi:hypothetical protein